MPARTIDGVLNKLDEIIRTCKRNENVAGYFAALYRRVTAQVQAGIIAGRFEDGPRMERLDVVFANRYIEAWRQHTHGEIPTMSWRYAFQRAEKRQGLVIQHLLLGMNAHINLDLAIAAAQTAPGAAYLPLQRDFDEINTVLAELFDEVQMALTEISPLMHLVKTLSHKAANEVLLNFSMTKARNAAWAAGLRLSQLPDTAQGLEIAALDAITTTLAGVIYNPSMEGTTLHKTILLAEQRDVVRVIESIEGHL